MILISKIAFELNVASYRIIEVLRDEFTDEKIDSNNTKRINEEKAEFLRTYFQKDKELKKLVENYKPIELFDIDDGFLFTGKEKDFNDKMFNEYSQSLSDLENLKAKRNKFWALNNDEIGVLMNLKLSKIELIQKKIKELREIEIEKINDIKTSKSNYIETKNTEFWNLD